MAADKDAEYGLRSLLTDPQDRLAIRKITFDCIVHPQHDAGVRRRPETFLRGRLTDFDRALVIFDFEGSGAEDLPVEQIERSTEDLLIANGWQDRCAAIVIVPELESWIWDHALNARKAADPKMSSQMARSLLLKRGFLLEGQTKPDRPKEAFEILLRETKTKRSASLFSQLAKTIDLKQCTDRSFAKFTTTLRTWFPVE